jgi:hypothetical protein
MPDRPRLRAAEYFALELLSRVADIEEEIRADDEAAALEAAAQLLAENAGVERLNQSARSLEIMLRDADYRGGPIPELERGEEWTLGSRTVLLPPRRILRGYAQPARRVPIISGVQLHAVAFLINLPGGRDYLKREMHGPVGWHYHYLDDEERRSNVILCWDTRAQPGPRLVRPLFYEEHGEGKAAFTARPDLWGQPKKCEMHTACSPDLRRPIREFRCASNRASPVWPINAVLTPRPVQPGQRQGARRR